MIYPKPITLSNMQLNDQPQIIQAPQMISVQNKESPRYCGGAASGKNISIRPQPLMKGLDPMDGDGMPKNVMGYANMHNLSYKKQRGIDEDGDNSSSADQTLYLAQGNLDQEERKSASLIPIISDPIKSPSSVSHYKNISQQQLQQNNNPPTNSNQPQKIFKLKIDGAQTQMITQTILTDPLSIQVQRPITTANQQPIPPDLQLGALGSLGQDIFYSARSTLSKQFNDLYPTIGNRLNNNAQPQTVPAQQQQICFNINELHIQTNNNMMPAATSSSSNKKEKQANNANNLRSQSSNQKDQEIMSTYLQRGGKQKNATTSNYPSNHHNNQLRQNLSMSPTSNSAAAAHFANKKNSNKQLYKKVQAAQNSSVTKKPNNQHTVSPQIQRSKRQGIVRGSKAAVAGGKMNQQLIEDEEKVPNEHPIMKKAPMLGIGQYQSNYFSQSHESQNQNQEEIMMMDINAVKQQEYSLSNKNVREKNKRHVAFEEPSECLDKDLKKRLSSDLESFGAVSFSAKKRQPTMMPYNLPGDEIDQVDKNEEKKQRINQQANGKPSKKFIYQMYPQQIEQNYMSDLSYVAGIGDLNDTPLQSEQFQSQNEDRQQAIYSNNSRLNRPQMLAQSRQPTASVPKPKDPRDMTQNELINEVEVLRKELRSKDVKMRKIANDGQRLLRENQQLGLKLQFETKNNSLLLKNLNRMRQNYFQSINSPQNSNLNHSETHMNPQMQFMQQMVASPIQSSVIESLANPTIEDQQMLKPPKIQTIQLLRDQEEEKIMPMNESSIGQSSEQSEQSFGIQPSQGDRLVQPLQMIQGSEPPTRASQIGNARATALYQRISPQQQTLLSRGNSRRQNLQQLMRNHIQRRHNPSRINQPMIEEDASLHETQHNDETVLINKVNEMQIKTSRFDQPFLHFHNFFRSEDFIPNEEPLINVREFWAGDMSHSYRMRLPQYNLQSFGISNNNNGGSGRMMRPGAIQGVYERASRLPNQGYMQLPGGIIQFTNQQITRQASQRGAAAGIQNNIPSRRTFGLPNHQIAVNHRTQIFPTMRESGNFRIRVSSHGPPLRSINGDSHSLLEDEINDLTGAHHVIGAQSNMSHNSSNIIYNGAGNQFHQHRNSHQQQHALLNQYHSDDSILDLEEEEKHQALPMRSNQMFHQLNNRGGVFANLRPMGPPGASNPMSSLHPGGGFSFDDGGMDEYDVADERVHLWEFINPDNMTYEEILALQDRIGYVTKGLSRDQINSFPKMRRQEVLEYLQRINGKKSSLQKPKKYQIEEEKHQPLLIQDLDLSIKDISEIDIKNHVAILSSDSKASKKLRKPTNRSNNQPNGLIYMLEEDNIDEVLLDGDEGILNHRLSMKAFNNQIDNTNQQQQPQNIQLLSLRQVKRNPSSTQKLINRNADEEDGIENCKEEDEERKEVEGRNMDQSVSRQVMKEKDPNFFDVQSNEDMQLPNEDNLSPIDVPKLNSALLDQSNAVQSSSESSNALDRCAICFDGMKRQDYVKILTCTHYYHCECIDQWLTVEKRCPMCMMYLDKNNPIDDVK